MDALDEFKVVSGLVPSLPKSTAFFCNVPDNIKNAILSIMPFLEEKLPVNYLGVPLISSRLLNRDCKVLVEKVQNRVNDWKNKVLSFASRLRLCKSVISSMHVYWASVLVIPVGIINEINQIMRGFLWFNGELKKGKAKVKWEDICLPKHEGGLGLRNLEIFNLALMATHLWNIASNRESLWVRWVHTYKLDGRTIWDVQERNNMSWGWRKLLQLRAFIRPHFCSILGDGLKTSLWYDHWCDTSPLSRFITPREVAREGFTLKDCVADLVVNNTWNWPLSWLAKAPDLGLIPVPLLSHDKVDTLKWKDRNGNLIPFSVNAAWEVLRHRGNTVAWYSVVWFPHHIPRHAFQLWLVMRRSLKTQDKLRPWDVSPSTDLDNLKCSLCELQRDSHEHIFFECTFSYKVWMYIRSLVDMDNVPPILHDIVLHFQAMGHARMAKNVVGKLLLAAMSYVIWNERNNRLFRRVKRTPEDIRDSIMVMIRLKILSMRFKDTENVRKLLTKWNMPKGFRLYV